MSIPVLVRVTIVAATVVASSLVSQREQLEATLRRAGENVEGAHWIEISWKRSELKAAAADPNGTGSHAHRHEPIPAVAGNADVAPLLSGTYRLFAASERANRGISITVRDIRTKSELGRFAPGYRNHEPWGEIVVNGPCLCQVEVNADERLALEHETIEVAVALIRRAVTASD